MELTINQVKERLLDKKMLELLVGDYEYGMAIASFEETNCAKYFKQTPEEKAKEIAKHIQFIMEGQLVEDIKNIIENEGK